MESEVLSVARQRRRGRSNEVFLDTLIQANLTERQVTFNPDTKSSEPPVRRHL